MNMKQLINRDMNHDSRVTVPAFSQEKQNSVCYICGQYGVS